MSEAVVINPPTSDIQQIPERSARQQIKETLSTFIEPGNVFEIRALNPYASSGYFKDINIAAEKIATLDEVKIHQGIYFTINPVKSGLLARRSNKIEKARGGETTSKVDVLKRSWLYIDIDPVRPSGISSTDDEIELSVSVAEKVRGYLSGMGFSEPVYADSGNGRHLLYKIDLPNNHESEDIIKGIFKTLSMFNLKKPGDPDSFLCTVDPANFDANRICKLYGTLSRKGDNLPDRPHRRSRIISKPDIFQITPIEVLKTVANISKSDEKPVKPHDKNASEKLVSDYLDEWGIGYTVKPSGSEITYILDTCPFCGDKKTAYASQPNKGGAITLKCHHENSCVGTVKNSWKQLRAKYEPDYDPEKEFIPVKEFTPEPKPKKSKSPDDTEESEPIRHLPFFEKEGVLYITCMTPEESYRYAHMDNGSVIFTNQELDPMGILTEPPNLPMHQDRGTTVLIVGLPRTDILSNTPSISPGDLYTRMKNHLHKYADAPEIEYEVFVYFCLYSWFYPKCGTAPYLRFIGDTGKGKSRFLKVTSDMCFYPIKASGSSSLSGIMRFKEKWNGTLLIDESDLSGDQSNNLIKYLNLGFEKDNFFILTDKNDVSKTQVFDPFGPKVIAMRQPFGDVATEGRCLSFSPNETCREDIPSELPRVYYSEVAEIRALIARFVMEHWKDISEDDMISCAGMDIEPRLKQMARPLSIILRLFPDGEERFKQYLQVRQVELKQTRAESWEGSLFNYILALAIGEEDLITDPEFGKYYYGGTIQAITSKMLVDPFKSKAKTISQALKGIGMDIKQKRITIQTKDGVKSIRVMPLLIPNEQKWHEITQRYYYSQNGDPIPPCPDCLKGPEYPTRQTTFQHSDSTPTPDAVVHDVHDVNDHTHTHNQETPQETPSFPLEDLGSGVYNTSLTSLTSLTDTQPPDSVSEWKTRYKFPSDFPVSEYIPMPLEKRKGSICFCHPCDDKNRPLYWVPGRYHQICQPHFNELQELLKKEQEGTI